MSTTVLAQWKLGALGGACYNKYTSDEHYLSDLHNEGTWNWTFGLAGQYDFKKWEWMQSRLGIRAEINYTNKAYEKEKHSPSSNDEIAMGNKFHQKYFQLPIMMSYSIGGEKFRGFVNLGGYGGVLTKRYEWSKPFCLGGVGGFGCEYTFKQCTFQAELRSYADVISTTKSDRALKTPHYNTTLAIQAAVFYNIK